MNISQWGQLTTSQKPGTFGYLCLSQPQIKTLANRPQLPAQGVSPRRVRVECVFIWHLFSPHRATITITDITFECKGHYISSISGNHNCPEVGHHLRGQHPELLNSGVSLPGILLSVTQKCSSGEEVSFDHSRKSMALWF